MYLQLIQLWAYPCVKGDHCSEYKLVWKGHARSTRGWVLFQNAERGVRGLRELQPGLCRPIFDQWRYQALRELHWVV